MYLYQSNRLENLFSLLCKTLARPLTDPLAAEIIVVQNPGMARWLTHNLAQKTGIAANLEFPLPASFIWQIFEETLGELPDLSNFTREVLLWRILAELQQLSSEPSMDEIRAYLKDDPDGLRAFQLANTISDLFDQYLVFRPEMLLKWEQSTGLTPRAQDGNDSNHDWQARLWRKLARNHPLHRASLLQNFFKRSTSNHLQTENLPERICIFGINTMAPAYLAVIEQISKHIDIHIFHLSPCRQAWDDILPERLLALKRRSWRDSGLADVSAYFTTGNPLLASMGMVGREFFSLLLQYNPIIIDDYQPPPRNSLLTNLQADILDLQDQTTTPGQPFDPADTSIAFHDCHSPMREVQVLHDRLLDLFAADPELKPADILVMAPDIGCYAPYIAGVFGAAEDKLFIPWSIADRNTSEEDMVTDGFLDLLALSAGRCTATEIMTLLEKPVIGEKFLISKDDVASLRLRIKEAGIRWGLDKNQRRARGLEDSNLHTWDFGLQRLLLGHITGPLESCWQDIMPSATKAGNTGSWLGGLAGFIRHLKNLQTELRHGHTAKDWSKILLQMIDIFFTDDRPEYTDAIRRLRETIHDFAAHTKQADCSCPLSVTTLRAFFSEQLAVPSNGHPFLAGKVTFCNMVPMRSVPFKVIWLLGMNDTDYPRSQRPQSFDRMAKKPRLGDRNRRDDDRYLFLEALLSARNHFIVSWIGHDQRENTELPPSVLVAELRDYIDRSRQMRQTAASELLTTHHPLQPFSKNCFNTNPKTAAYADMWLPTPCSRHKNQFLDTPLPDLELQQVELGMLVRFWNHPVRFFMEQRLGLRPNMNEELLPESEPFTLDHLEAYKLSMNTLGRLLAGQDPLPLCRQAQASALLPRGEIGRINCRQILCAAENILRQVREYSPVPATTHDISLTIAGIHITGRLDGLHPGGRVSFRPAKHKAKDLLQLWIHHLILNLVRPPSIDPLSTHIATDAAITLAPVDDPKKELEKLINLFLQGLNEPLHFYPESSYALASAKKESTGMNKAHNSWYSGYRRGEEEDPAYMIGLRGQDPLDEQFRSLATVFHPILNVMEKEDAAA